MYMRYDYQKLYEKNAEFLLARPKLTRAVRILNKAITAVFMLGYGGFLAFALLRDYAPIDLIKILLSPALCLFAVTILRLAIDRARPYDEKGAGITPLHEKKGNGKSFPSRHIAAASVIATTLVLYLPWTGFIAFPLTLALGYTRFALGLHYPTDLLAGLLLGLTFGFAPLFF